MTALERIDRIRHGEYIVARVNVAANILSARAQDQGWGDILDILRGMIPSEKPSRLFFSFDVEKIRANEAYVATIEFISEVVAMLESDMASDAIVEFLQSIVKQGNILFYVGAECI